MFLTSDVFVFIFKNFKNIVLSALFVFGLLYVNTLMFFMFLLVLICCPWYYFY